MLYQRSSPFFRTKITHFAIIFSLMFFIGAIILIGESTFSYRKSEVSKIEIAVKVLDEQLNSAKSAVDSYIALTHIPCTKLLPSLMNSLIEKPIIQSISMLEGDKITCSSYTPIIGKYRATNHLNSVELVKSQLLMPNEPIILLKETKGNKTVAATLHGINYLSVVKLLAEDSSFYLSTPNGWLSKQGLIATKTPYRGELDVHSKLFPFSIGSDVNYPRLIAKSLATNAVNLVFLAFVSFFVAFYYCVFKQQKIIKRAIRKGLKKKEMTPYIQALVDKDGNTVGGEILIRWRYRSSLLPPNLFIPIAESSGLIVPMTLQLLDEVYQTCLKHAHIFTERFHLSVNICPVQLSKSHSAALIQHCKKFSQHSALRNIALTLEVTERQIIANDAETLQAIQELHDLGVEIALDDFGTGYSSLENLREFKIEAIKIDKSFIDGLPNRALSGDIIDNMLDLAKRLKIETIAEGVETQIQADHLIDRQVNYLQGYLFHKPEALERFLEQKGIRQAINNDKNRASNQLLMTSPPIQ